MVNKNTAEIIVMQEHVKDLGMQCKETDDTVKKLNEWMTGLQERQEEAERYSRRWNFCLLNLPEHSNEDVGREVMEIIAQIIPEDKNKLGFLVDTVHRVGKKRDENKSRPIIMQFSMRTFRQSVESFPQFWRDEESTDGRRPLQHGETMQEQTLATC